MTDAPNRYETLMARLAADPGWASLAEPGAGVLVWDRGVERLLWVSPAAGELRGAYADERGRLIVDVRALERLKALGAGLAPHEGTRLERLRLDPVRPWLPVTCACRLAALDSGEVVLVTLFVGPVPKAAQRLRTATLEGEGAGASGPPAKISLRDAQTEPTKPQGTVRFVWQTDVETRFTHVSPDLADAVGPRAADIVGRTWDEVSRSVAEDPEGMIAALFARGETWSGRTVFWSVDGSSRQVPVDWAGMPISGPNGDRAGFRGFGLLRMDAVREREASNAEPVDSGAQDGPPAEEIQAEEPAFNVQPQEEESWFTQLRDRVAEALSGSKSSEQDAGEEPGSSGDKAGATGPSRLSHAERSAFREIARALSARLEPEMPPADSASPAEEDAGAEEERVAPARPAASANGDLVLDRLPIGILVHRGESVLFANRFLLEMTGYEGVEQVEAEGGIVRLFRGSPALGGAGEDDTPLALTTRQGENIPVTVRLSAAEWDGAPAQLMLIRAVTEKDTAQRLRESRVQELEAILDTATDGVLVLDETGRILSMNRSAEALFGYDQREVIGKAATVLLAPESHGVALGYLEGLRSPGVASLLNDGREVLGRVRQGGTIPLFMTMGHLNEGSDRRFCAVLRDITAFKKAEGELVGAKRAAEEASAQKSDLLAKISHEIRTPLNAIIGFAEVMLEERFGPIGNERYKEYLKDVHASGAHVISLVNDLLDLAKVEAGRLELSFTSVNLNDLIAACVTLLQPQAARERIVMRTSFAPKLPPVVADERSVRQIALNLVSNAIKFTDAGGQVIVSTAVTDRGEVAFRVRDTGIGMTEKEVEAALEPFRQIATARRRGGTGLGLPLTKALVEANRGALQIASHPNEGTLVEVIFPPTRVLAE